MAYIYNYCISTVGISRPYAWSETVETFVINIKQSKISEISNRHTNIRGFWNNNNNNNNNLQSFYRGKYHIL
jgi:hypothetical protein